jgi:RTX calcium-binding nonapeptide repeat (4 copies)
MDYFTLTAGADTVMGSAGYDTIHATAETLNAGDSLNGGEDNDTLVLHGTGTFQVDQLRTFSGIESIVLSFPSTTSGYATVVVNSPVARFENYYPDQTKATLATTGATFDLSHSTVNGFNRIDTYNSAGTNFTVRDIGTALLIHGGVGVDTITAQGFAFSAEQRNAIFANSSMERIVDASGTYTASPYSFVLATGSDTVTGTSWHDTVNATAETLNSGDSLIGGEGGDTLRLLGSGTFRVDQLGTFTGFE